MNNRVKSIEITDRSDTVLFSIDLQDSRDAQVSFFAPLNPGTYRLRIADVYPGSRWADTCLAELVAFPVSADGSLEPFLTDPFFRNSLAQLR